MEDNSLPTVFVEDLSAELDALGTDDASDLRGEDSAVPVPVVEHEVLEDVEKGTSVAADALPVASESDLSVDDAGVAVSWLEVVELELELELGTEDHEALPSSEAAYKPEEELCSRLVMIRDVPLLSEAELRCHLLLPECPPLDWMERLELLELCERHIVPTVPVRSEE